MEHLQHIFDGSPNGLLLFKVLDGSDDWKCLSANKAADGLLAYDQLEGKLMSEILPSLVASNFKGALTSLVSDDALDFFLSDQNRWVLASANRSNGYITIALSDITRLKEGAFADRSLMRLYKSLSNSMDDNEIVLFDKDFNILLSEGSPRFIRLGVEGDMKGTNLNTLFETNPFTFLGEYASKVFGGERTDVEREVNGKFYKASVYSDKQDDDTQADNLVGVLLLKDVTELNKKQRELEVRIKQLDRSNRELQQFAYIASHDLQEPLRKIMSFSERLNRKYGAFITGEGQEYITRMINASQRMETLINDLLSFSRVTRIDLPFEPTDLNQVFKHVIADMDAIERKEAHIELPESFPIIEAIPSQMRQLFQNLFTNALKFTHAERASHIKVRCRQVTGGDLSEMHALMLGKDYCLIEVEDNGIGFEQANAERIFAIFQRLHGRSEYSGTGVGLSICKKITDNHQGEIFATGKPDIGAVFTVVLPLKQ